MMTVLLFKRVGFYLKAIFRIKRQFSFVILQFCSLPREKCFLLIV